VLVAPTHWGSPGQLAQLVSVAHAAAQRGWLICLPEHASQRGYAPSALALAGLVLGATKGAHVATTGVVAGSRDPLSVARDADVLASAARERGGGFTLGLVAGYDPNDLPDGRFENRHRALDAVAAAVAGVAVLVGASGPVGIRRAARAAGWMAPTHVGLDRMRALADELTALNPAAEVLALRRWLAVRSEDELSAAPLAAGVRTPRTELVGGGAAAVARRVSACWAAGAATVALGPVSSMAQFEILAADLAEVAHRRTSPEGPVAVASQPPTGR
jgi:alkanesulfonate monooxygenase SsuD/methylene tetrahydromethanopterin reductase-like flavin-dependent oxidoreductase (luciferase family)